MLSAVPLRASSAHTAMWNLGYSDPHGYRINWISQLPKASNTELTYLYDGSRELRALISRILG
jgi:hypothetical protein